MLTMGIWEPQSFHRRACPIEAFLVAYANERMIDQAVIQINYLLERLKDLPSMDY
jgi:hypothetical protein